MTRLTMLFGLAATFLLASLPARAEVSSDQVARLGADLTPMGAETIGNPAHGIPDWNGGLPKNAAPVTRGFLGDPFAQEKPLLVIDAGNASQYKDQLSAGQLAMLATHPDTYRIPVYPTHRTTALPPSIYQAVKYSAANTRLTEGGNGLLNFAESRYYAFPIPKNGIEVVWNHLTRYRGGSVKRHIAQAAPQRNGDYTLIRLLDQFTHPEAITDVDPTKMGNLIYFLQQKVVAPSRLAGNVLVVHETANQVVEPRKVWMYNAGQRRVRRAPQVAYDGPGQAADGQRTADNLDLFNGAPDRYDWELVGKKEMYIPYNSYRLASPELKYKDLLTPGHINQAHTRYELHRVWEVVATLKPGARHIYTKRHYYIDEDSWQIALADHYDSRGNLWRVAEGHALQFYDNEVPGYAAEVLYDLVNGRYLAVGLANEEERGFEYGLPAVLSEFSPASLRTQGVR